MKLIEEYEEVVRLWVESPEFAQKAHDKFLRKLRRYPVHIAERDAQMAVLALDFWLKDMYSKGVEGGLDEPWCAYDAIANKLGMPEWEPALILPPRFESNDS